jgi:hypothetical protein
MMSQALGGLAIVVEAGGWPGVLEERHLQAAADLLDDPVPMLEVLRELPTTLLHGKTQLADWRVDIFDEVRLVDWSGARIGPPVWDLVSFVEQHDLLADRPGGRATVETIEDTHIVSMVERLGKRFNAVEARRAIPAARALYVLATWFPRLGRWFDSASAALPTWTEVNGLGPAELEASGFVALGQLRGALRRAFGRFNMAYRAL